MMAHNMRWRFARTGQSGVALLARRDASDLVVATFKQPLLDRERRGSGAVGEIEFHEDIGNVTLDGVLAETEFLGDLGVRQATRQAAKNFAFTRA